MPLTGIGRYKKRVPRFCAACQTARDGSGETAARVRPDVATKM
jgi:hypothetical protein